MPTRREFLATCALAGVAVGAAGRAAAGAADAREAEEQPEPDAASRAGRPLVVSTWNFGVAANAAAWRVLEGGGAALDAVEAGARVPESDPANHSVGLGGYPDRDGHVTLDACIMDDRGRAGSVCFLEGIEHPVSVARLVMERTPHVMLAGAGALRFAREQGFPERDLLTEDARRAWLEWRREAKYEPRANAERHDTLGILARDRDGRLAGACTTSGLAFKLHGRVGDSPIVGAALFVDGRVGAATATGHGEFVMRTLGGFLVVELMRQGCSPQEACEEAIARIAGDLGSDPGEVQVGYLAIDAAGRIGAHAVRPGFQYAWRDGEREVLVDAPAFFGD
ncbi:MAG TPA: N(4)-(beta-N-acetylglucosaminyl)-L-asparaginase [Candidatus Krumholzibacteria bacterium]|nr:N(4)-(beta-N-acetylglucosaminyl)-L-asparaginase [Candidatus Krumholzibacteria bacterium]HPD73228.1 N(4)-(beta-N-acetylglucosaminyl)-L-asparaginase [Candidatus Krumholzibacteria bacterium]HRY40190.1 N(4)-(beta-N-acetylglucosaminyl)-L-asparaginase [Candidatus Krumholzibacteria bacterium]